MAASEDRTGHLFFEGLKLFFPMIRSMSTSVNGGVEPKVLIDALQEGLEHISHIAAAEEQTNYCRTFVIMSEIKAMITLVTGGSWWFYIGLWTV